MKIQRIATTWLAFGFALISVNSTFAVTPSASPAPSASPSASPSPAAAPLPSPIPAIYSDTKVPQIRSLTTSTTKAAGLFNLNVQMIVRVHRNTLNSINITLTPRNSANAPVDPIFQAPCTKLGPISASALSPTGELASLQSRTIDSDWYLETYAFTSTTKLATNQDICTGDYVITALNLVDAAKHTLSITANLASTATTKNNLNDVAAQQSNIWANHIELASCPQAINANGTTTTVPGKTTVIQGKTVQLPPTTTTVAPNTAVTLRTTCDQTIDFARAYLSIIASTSIASQGVINSSGTSSLPVVDYATQTKAVMAENEKLKSEQDRMTKQIDFLKKEVQILISGGKPPADPAATPAPSSSSAPSAGGIDYPARIKALQAQVDSLTKQNAALAARGATVPAPNKTVPRMTPPNTSANQGAPRSTNQQFPTKRPITVPSAKPKLTPQMPSNQNRLPTPSASRHHRYGQGGTPNWRYSGKATPRPSAKN